MSHRPLAYPAFLLAATRFTPGRLRLRIPEKRNDGAYFAALVAAGGKIPGVLESRANPRTGSLLFIHDRDRPERLLEEVAARAGLDLQPREKVPEPGRLAGLDEREAAALKAGAYAAMALVQLARGFPLGPATTLWKQSQSYWSELQRENESGRI